MRLLILPFILFTFSLKAIEPTDATIRMLYNSLNPKSISEHLAFYQLYPHSVQGKIALQDSWKLLSGGQTASEAKIESLTLGTYSIIDTLINLVNKKPEKDSPVLSSHELQIIEHLANRLSNRNLKGFKVTTETEIFSLKSDEIDLARALFLSQLGNDQKALQELKNYEAMIDLMALQILANLPEKASAEIKIAHINEFIFEEMGFRFPPHSLYAKDIDVYTFLPSVLDSRKGVCLGVSILYICLAQRLDLTLEMVTPPGHIYVRYRDGDQIINIETTARGIHLDCDEYLSVETRSLELRNIKEVIGLAHYNLAATFWHKEDHEKTIEAYLKALPYLPNDMQLKELLGFAYLLNGNKDKGEELLKITEKQIPDYAVSRDLMAEEYLNGYIGIEGIRAVFKPVDETRASIVEKKEALQKVLVEHPKFASGIFALAVTWLQLHRQKEALETLESYHQLDPNNPTVEYYLAALYSERYDYNKAWEHLNQVEKLVKDRSHNPKTVKNLRKELFNLSPI